MGTRNSTQIEARTPLEAKLQRTGQLRKSQHVNHQKRHSQFVQRSSHMSGDTEHTFSTGSSPLALMRQSIYDRPSSPAENALATALKSKSAARANQRKISAESFAELDPDLQRMAKRGQAARAMQLQSSRSTNYSDVFDEADYDEDNICRI
jgi:hypothetical protein